ncbi:MAG: CoA-binding protein [Epsilonproteobacteria bacterium]|nr:CoA-binding protein [Campylobacterota bacterium]NPA64207.1 CoA-binding protein [Campylobacterota bacterium]
MREYEIYELLHRYGIKTPRYKVYEIDQEFYFDHFPAVLKIASDKVVHKSDVGGVRVGIHSNEELQQAKREIINNLQNNSIFLDMNDRFIVEEEVHGVEFYIGGIFDSIFEEVLLFGKGGVTIEIERDICYIDSEADEPEILKSFRTTKISKIFPKFRGKEYKIAYVIDTIEKFQKLFTHEDIVEFDINPLVYTDEGFVAVDARVKTGQKSRAPRRQRSFDIFHNEKVAILGATDKPQKVGYALAKNALQSGADIYFVNPRLSRLFGKRVYKAIQELPDIDTAVIAIPSRYVLQSVEELAHKGAKNIIVISAGFKEVGNQEAEEELTKMAEHYDLNILGPNSLGLYNGDKELNLTFAADSILPGHIGLISQSGAVLSALIDKSLSYALGFSHILSLGNMADFDFADAIETLQNKRRCRYINLYAEGLTHGKPYLRAIRKSAKPIAIYKAGKSEEAKRAAFSHTGNISGDYEMLVGLSYAAGAIIKKDIDELVFSSLYAEKREALIVTNAGGPGTILTDILVSHGKKMASLDEETIQKLSAVLPPTWSKNNPIDIIGDATSKRYKAVLDIVYDEKRLIFVIVTPQYMTDGLNIAKTLLAYPNAVPIFFGEERFKEAFELFKEHKRIHFNDLENVANIL